MEGEVDRIVRDQLFVLAELGSREVCLFGRCWSLVVFVGGCELVYRGEGVSQPQCPI